MAAKAVDEDVVDNPLLQRMIIGATLADVCDRCGVWYVAQLVGVDSKALRWTFVGWSADYDEWIPVENLDVRVKPVGTHTLQVGCRPAVGQRVDVYDAHPARLKWMTGTVIAIRQNDRQVFVHYTNFSAEFEEWISEDARRLRPYHAAELEAAMCKCAEAQTTPGPFLVLQMCNNRN